VHWAGDDANPTIDTLLLIYVHRRPNGDAVIFQNRRHMCERFFRANNRADLAADAFIQVPGHQIIPCDHAAMDGHGVFIARFLG